MRLASSTYDAGRSATPSMNADRLTELARVCGFELAGVASALASEDLPRFEKWRAAGCAGEMSYLTDHRGDVRSDPRQILPNVKSILCVGKLYQTPHPLSTEPRENSRGWISRYAWGRDYHDVLRAKLEQLLALIKAEHVEPFESKICVDTAPLLERSYARAAGLGWIGKNTCLINEQQGSWFFLGEILLSIPLAPGTPPPDRCGTCRRCIDACPTQAIIQNEKREWTLDARSCISYMTIEQRGQFAGEELPPIGSHIFGCDICQDVCPWNRRAPNASEDAFTPAAFAPPLEEMALLSEEEFRRMFRQSPVWRAKYQGFLRNVAAAMGHSKNIAMKQPLSAWPRIGTRWSPAPRRKPSLCCHCFCFVSF